MTEYRNKVRMSSMDIKISVLVPVYNVEKYLRDCLESIIQQSKEVYEVILVDDGSTDNSGVICDEYARDYTYFKSFHKRNQGLLSARRYAINKATGNWYIFLDSDDSLKRNAIQKIYDLIQQQSPDCIIYGLDRVKNGSIIKPFVPEIDVDKLITDKPALYELVFTHSSLNSLCRKAIRASISTEDYSAYYGISLAEDLLQSIEIYKKGNRFLLLRDSLYNYTVNDNSMTNSISIENYRIDFTVREMVVSFLRQENVFSREQWYRYNRYSLRIFVNQIKTVLSFQASSDMIKKLLKEMRNTDYYKTYITKISMNSDVLLDKWIEYAFRHEYDGLLLIINRLYKVKRRIGQCR